MQDMRILYISNTTSGGGAPSSLFNLVSGLYERHEIAVVLPDTSGPLYTRLVSLGVRCYVADAYTLDVWPKVYRPSKIIRRYLKLYRNRTRVPAFIEQVISEFHPDIVHTNVGPLAVGYRAAVKSGLPHVWHHREYQSKDFGLKFFPSEKKFREIIMSEGNYNIAITEGIFRHWNLREGKDAVIYNAVSKGPNYENTASNSQYFLYAARIEPSKDLMILLKAFTEYRMSGGRCKLYVAGRPCGFYAFRCRLYVRMHGLSDFVEFLGQRPDIQNLMAGASAFVMSSVSEGFGLTTVEAMLNRCLVIGRNTAGTKEQLDRGESIVGREIGLRFSAASELSECMLRVDEERGSRVMNQMLEDAFTMVSENYTIEKYASGVETFYKKVLEESGR